ncbi:MAG: YIP1 family protein, partial [Candidatus Omnitrophica bacterium]|nr:YIP1 family protein [Candidatus Omnitrophota bacterium]
MINLIKTFFSTWLKVIESPSKFFEQEQSNFANKKTLLYLSLLTISLAIFQSISFILALMLINKKLPSVMGSIVPLFSFENLSISIMVFFIFGFVQALILFMLQILVKCRLKFNEVFAISVYSMSPLLISALPVGPLKVLVPIWQIVIIVMGIKQCAKISNFKTAAILVPYVLLVLVAALIHFQRVALPKAQQLTQAMTEQISKDTHMRVLLDESDSWKAEVQDDGKIIRRKHHENGNLKKQICYKNQYAAGGKDIVWEKQYNEQGILTFSKQYQDEGRSEIVTKYWNDGTIKEEHHYKEGKIVDSKGGALHYGFIKNDEKRF